MEKINISEVVHYHRTVKGAVENGELVMYGCDEIPCNPDRDEVLSTGTTFDKVNCPECIALMTE